MIQAQYYAQPHARNGTAKPSYAADTYMSRSMRSAAAASIAFTLFATSPAEANNTREPFDYLNASALSADRDRLVETRTAELFDAAQEEGVPFSKASTARLHAFLAAHPRINPPAIFLLPDGSVRAIWRTAKSEQIALAFRPSGMIQFVIFSCAANGQIDRATGEARPSRISSFIAASGANHIFTA